jgi:hypothetical protein
MELGRDHQYRLEIRSDTLDEGFGYPGAIQVRPPG